MHLESDRYYSTSEVGRRLGVSRQRIDQLLKSGELEGQKDPNTGRWRIPSESLSTFLSTHQPRTPQRRLEDHPAFGQLKGEVGDLRDRLSHIEVRLEFIESLLQELREELLRSAGAKETDGASSDGEG